MNKFQPIHLDATYHDLDTVPGMSVYLRHCFDHNRLDGMRFLAAQYESDRQVRQKLNLLRDNLARTIAVPFGDVFLSDDVEIDQTLHFVSRLTDEDRSSEVRRIAQIACAEIYENFGVALTLDIFELPEGKPPQRPKRKTRIQVPLN